MEQKSGEKSDKVVRGKQNVVLIVDDVKQNIDALISILASEYQIMAALSGSAAIKSMEKKLPDIVLLDISMTDMNGFDVLKHMKTVPTLANIPVIFVTGEANLESEEAGLLLGAVDYIKKPYNAEIIKIKVRNHLELKMYRDDLENLVEQRTEEVRMSRDAIIVGMSLLAESRDHVTGDHITRMQRYTEILAYKMVEMFPSVITFEYAAKTVLFSPLHDIGKVGITDAILQKPGKLTFEEYEEMKGHTSIGAELLRQTDDILQESSKWLNVAVQIAECHHEKYSGKGYPNGLKGEEIPLCARIVALADVYDALTSERPYKKPFSHEMALDIILNGDGRTSPEDFDVKVLEALEATKEEFRDIAIKYSYSAVFGGQD